MIISIAYGSRFKNIGALQPATGYGGYGGYGGYDEYGGYSGYGVQPSGATIGDSSDFIGSGAYIQPYGAPSYAIPYYTTESLMTPLPRPIKPAPLYITPNNRLGPKIHHRHQRDRSSGREIQQMMAALRRLYRQGHRHPSRKCIRRRKERLRRLIKAIERRMENKIRRIMSRTIRRLQRELLRTRPYYHRDLHGPSSSAPCGIDDIGPVNYSDY